MTQFEAVVVGNAGIDTNVYLPGADIDFNVEANFTENIDCVGQAGGYASRGFARLGCRTAFIGYVGDDHNGRLIRETFAADGIDTSALFLDPTGTAHSINLMYRDGRRKNFYDGKGHLTAQPNLEACRAVLSQTRLAHFNIPNWGRYLLPIAKEHNVIISCDVQDVVDIHDPYRRDYVEQADILFFSAANYDDPTPLINAYWSLKSALVMVVGLGSRGCALGAAGKVQFFQPVQLDQPVIDTNGAGDSLAVGFLTSHILQNYSLEDSILRGQIAARHKCAQRASSSNLITPEELDQHYRRLKR